MHKTFHPFASFMKIDWIIRHERSESLVGVMQPILVYLPSPKYPDKPALLVELKWNQDANTAISQIHRQRYPESLQKYRNHLILVGINYDKDVSNNSKSFKHHSCVIEMA